MSQRDSGYKRIELDSYETPEWVTKALVPHIEKLSLNIWEPAAGSGKMATALHNAGFKVNATDIITSVDFLNCQECPHSKIDAIVTNPPYTLAQQFINRALHLMKNQNGIIAMLLRTDFDHAKTRQHLFGQCPQFAKKLVLTKRIKWFENSTGSPSFNHAWYIWDWKHKGLPTLAYGP